MSSLNYQRILPYVHGGYFSISAPFILFLQESLTDAAAGTAMEFQKFENDVIRAYGVPKNLLVEVGLLSSLGSNSLYVLDSSSVCCLSHVL